ncbi:MAG: fibronectin type III domain-containing protein, partial [Clostridiales bacterium]|nr:fibronectin type III domain-containing protein [Clostridiales bacterium]
MKLFLNLSENLKEKILIFVLMLLITFFVGAKIVSSLESPDPEIKLIIKEAQWSSESKVDNLKLDLTIGFSNEVKHDNIYLVNDVPLYGYSYEISDSGGLVGRTQSIYNCGKGQNNEYRGDSFFPSSEDISKQANIYSIPFLVNLKPIYFPDNKYDPNETYEIMVKADYWDGNDKDFYAFESNKSKIVSPVSCKNPEKIDSERVSLEPTHDSIKIKWSKIDNWGDNQLNDDGREYIVKISKDSDVIEENFVSHLSTKIDYDLVFTNLEPNKHYDISIQTKNIAELSSEELIFWEQTLLTRPDIPGDFKVQKIGSDYVKLAWNKVNNWGDSKEYHKARESNETEDELETSTLPAEWPPKKYILEYKENNKNNWSKIELEFDDESETINGLKHNTLYNFRISSFNFERDSGFTSVNARTTKKFNYNDPDESSSESDLVDKDSESTEEENNNNQSEEQNEIIQPEIPTPLPIQTYTLNDIKTPEYFKTRDFINGYENKT